MVWNVLTTDADIKKMGEVLKISPITARVLANRSIRSKRAAERFLRPSQDGFHDTELMADVKRAAQIIARARAKNVKTVVYGDYDVDGVMSITILYKTLKKFGFDVSFFVPRRDEEGYGLNMSAVEKICQDGGGGAKLIITCDNGISAGAEVARAKELGAAVVVFDHHEPPFDESGDILPGAAATVDPKRKDCTYPFKGLCAAGIAFKFAEYFNKLNNAPFAERDEFLALAAVATHCDVVDLTDENRLIASLGAQIINAGNYRNIGLWALIKERKLLGKKIGDFEIGFLIGPCVNASGRISTAKTAVELFTAGDKDAAITLAKELVALNEDRKALTAAATKDAVEEAAKFAGSKVLVLYLENAHESIAGIVAGRVREASGLPVVVFTKSADKGILKGSARSIAAYDIFKELYKFKDLYIKFGGHAMAAGLSISEGNLPKLRELLNENCLLTEKDFEPKINIDGEVDLDEITFDLAREIDCLAPFGKANERPVFCAYGALTDEIDILGSDKSTLKFTFTRSGGKKLAALCFKKADEFFALLKSQNVTDKIIEAVKQGIIKKLNVKMDIAFTIELNEYNGSVVEQIKIVDFRSCPKGD